MDALQTFIAVVAVSIRAYIANLWNLRGAFRRTFLQENGKPHADAVVVLAEIKRFCYGTRPTLKQAQNGIDPYASIAAAARQEVWFRLASMLNLDDSDLHALEKRAQMEDQANG